MPSVFELTGGKKFGYVDGAQVTQTGSVKTEAVTLNAVAGRIITNTANLAVGATVKFVVNNTTVSEEDVVVVSIAAGNATGDYYANVTKTTTGTFEVALTNYSTTAGAEAVEINFVVIKSEVGEAAN